MVGVRVGARVVVRVGARVVVRLWLGLWFGLWSGLSGPEVSINSIKGLPFELRFEGFDEVEDYERLQGQDNCED